jgi:hypothetical protein
VQLQISVVTDFAEGRKLKQSCPGKKPRCRLHAATESTKQNGGTRASCRCRLGAKIRKIVKNLSIKHLEPLFTPGSVLLLW